MNPPDVLTMGRVGVASLLACSDAVLTTAEVTELLGDGPWEVTSA